MKDHSLNKTTYSVIGVMSGTSLDGLDLAACTFSFNGDNWAFEIRAAKTIKYPEIWEQNLKNAQNLTAEKFLHLHNSYGKYIGNEINIFLSEHNISADIIASHGHTIYHQPEKEFTFQIGNGASISAITGITTVSDFRTTDIALEGQGAPLVPIGDKALFSDFDYCLNLGGFANVSYEHSNSRIAFDICPVNFVLNFFAEKEGLPFDKGGILGKSRNINWNLFNELNKIDYYHTAPPKSLGREWVENCFFNILNKYKISNSDKMRTVYEHTAFQIGNTFSSTKKVLITGGGAFNVFLIERIKNYTQSELVLPNEMLIDYKEALIFAFLGLLRFQNKINCLASVTGANKDSSCGIIFNS